MFPVLFNPLFMELIYLLLVFFNLATSDFSDFSLFASSLTFPDSRRAIFLCDLFL